MSMDTSALAFPKHRPAVIAKAAKASAHDRKLAKAYETVNARDGNHCRVTGVELHPASSDEKRRREHHHLKGRRVQPTWVYKPERIVLVSAYVHKLLQSSALLPDGCDARKPIRFAWNRRIVKPGKAPFRLRPEVAV